MTDFNNGLSSYGFPLVGSGPYITTGKVWFVHGPNGTGIGVDANGRGTNAKRPFATIEYALGKVQASKGDIIFVMPGHVETVSTAGGVTVDQAGISIIGLGRGANRPQINFTATAATMPISAASVHLENLRFTNGIDEVVNALPITGDDVTLLNCQYRDVTGIGVNPILATGADRLKIIGFEYLGDRSADSNDAAIQLAGCVGVQIAHSHISVRAATAAIECITTLSSQVYIHDCTIDLGTDGTNVAILDTITGSLGVMGPNLMLSLVDDAGNVTEAITGATFRVVDPVYVVNAANQKGLLINWTAVADS